LSSISAFFDLISLEALDAGLDLCEKESIILMSAVGSNLLCFSGLFAPTPLRVLD